MIITQEYQENWSALKKALFKFIFTYFALYIFLMFFSALVEFPTRWFGKLLGISYTYEANGNGSGDTTYAYVTLFMTAVLTVITAVLWIILDKKRKSYNKLLYWFITILRIYLVFFMFTYGFVKIIQLQFPYPSLTRMMQPLGDISPMGLAWTYLGYSKGFNIFMGIMEISGGLLLIPRRTSTLGAFVTFGVMMHVAVMNFMYDIPVKILSVHLALIALFIFSTDIKRFINIFIKNKATESYNYYNPIQDKTYHKAIFWMKLLFIIVLTSFFLIQGLGNDRGKNSVNRPFLYGVWEVQEYIKDGDTLQPLITSNEYWRYLIIENNDDRATVRMMNDSNKPFIFEADTITKKARVYGAGTGTETFNFEYTLLDNETLRLEGELYLYNLKIKLKKKEMLLDSRGFHWINERPYNR